MMERDGETPDGWRARTFAILRAFGQTPRVIRLVLAADRLSALGILVVSVGTALLPLAIAYVGKLLVDGVVLAVQEGSEETKRQALYYVGLELALMLASAFFGRLQGLLRTLLGARLGYEINGRILNKAQSLDLEHFENPKVYDKLQNARREASARPLNLFMTSVDIGSHALTLVSYGVVLATFSGWVLVVLLVATLPTFLAEARFSAEAFRLFTWRAPEGRRMRYLEMILTRDSHVKEVKLFGLGELLMKRYRAFYGKFFGEERTLALRRTIWGFGLGVISTLALYGCYGWIVSRTVSGSLTLGDMTLYMAVFRQGQSSLRLILRGIGSTYEDNLFMSNLFAFLEIPVADRPLLAPRRSTDTTGLQLVGVSFRYPTARSWAVNDINLHIARGEKLAIVGENGAGKTTLIKLLTGLYQPTEGQILLDGIPIAELAGEVLRRRFAVVLQDFVRYQFTASDNIGLGLPEAIDDRESVVRAAEKGGAHSALDRLAKGYDTQLGRWFEEGVDLSAGNWQKVAVSRAFMRDADILILDEPTASLDAEAEHELFERFRTLTEGRTAILISHRFSTVRMADRIMVLKGGKMTEVGTHEELLAQNGRYAHLFRLQAAGYT